MKNIFPLIILVFSLFSATAPVHARGLLEDLTVLNRIQPLQHPDLDKASEILDRRVLGRENKVLGEVNDVILNKNGNTAALNVEFDRLGFRQPVFINYNSLNIEPATNGYILGFEKAEVEKLYPNLLANVESAAGGAEETYALSRLIGTEVRTPGGQRIGKITDVLFGARGDRAEAFYITMESGRLRGKGIAVPYAMPVISGEGNRFKAVVSEEQASILTGFAQSQK